MEMNYEDVLKNYGKYEEQDETIFDYIEDFQHGNFECSQEYLDYVLEEELNMYEI